MICHLEMHWNLLDFFQGFATVIFFPVDGLISSCAMGKFPKFQPKTGFESVHFPRQSKKDQIRRSLLENRDQKNLRDIFLGVTLW